MRERVRYAAATLGYVANLAARALSAQRSGMVGIVSTSVGPLDTAILHAIQTRLVARGVGALFAMAAGSMEAEACAQDHVARGVDGVLFIGVSVPGSSAWRSRGMVPGVALGTSGPIASPRVAEDGMLGRGRSLITAYLNEYGHQRIGVIGPPVEAFAATATGMGTATVPAAIFRQVDRIHEVAALAAVIGDMREQRVTAFCLPDDYAAAAALKACRAMHLAVPGDVSIIGWGDAALGRWLTPTLSSVRLPIEAMATAAVDALLAAIAGDDYTWPELPVKLVVRESSSFAPD